jgi:hypothetical protein
MGLLRILQWNINGLKGHLSNLRNLIDLIKPDVILLQETRCTSDWLKLKHWTLYSYNRNTPNGGTAILVKDHIMQQEIPAVALHSDMSINGVDLFLGNKTLSIYSVYRPPYSNNIPEFLKIVTSCLSGSNPVLVCGDLNAKHVNWGCYKTNRAGIALLKYLTNYKSYVLAPEAVTHRHGASSDILDVVLMNNVDLINEVHNVNGFHGSDHSPVWYEVHDTLRPSTPVYRETITSWKSYKSKIISAISDPSSIPLDTIPQIDHAIESLNRIIMSSYHSSTTTTFKPVDSYPPSTLNKVRTRNRIYRRWSVYKCPLDLELINALDDEIDLEMQHHRHIRWKKTIDSISTDGLVRMWKLKKAICRQSVTNTPVMVNSTLLTKEEEILENNATFLENKFSSSSLPTRMWSHLPPVPLQITFQQVRYLLSHTPINKSPGPDNINGGMIRHLPTVAVHLLYRIFQSSINSCYFPRSWKVAKIILLQKNGKPASDPENLRPISLLSQLGKTLERLILQLTYKLLPKHFIRKEQYGFRKRKSAAAQAFRFLHSIKRQLKRGVKPIGLLLDMKAAFDKVPHWILAQKLRRVLPSNLVQLLLSYLNDRQFYVVKGKLRSSTRKIRAGVPQGGVLSPLLFCIFINDLPTVNKLKLFLYADDTAALTTAYKKPGKMNALRLFIRKIQHWATCNGMSFNPLKSELIHFGSSTKRDKSKLTLHDETIPWTKTAKYLGLHFNSYLSWATHAKKVLANLKARTFMLKPLLCAENLATKTKNLIYNSCIRSTATYAASCWYNISKTLTQSFIVAENTSIKFIYNPPPLTNLRRFKLSQGITPIDVYLADRHSSEHNVFSKIKGISTLVA